ncbi:MAG: alpha/beta hydrolase-fold protein [Gaiellaceae bacterium]
MITNKPTLADKPTLGVAPGRRLLSFVALTGAVATFVVVGLVGLYRYVDSFWLYRGFPPPHDPSFVRDFGTFETIRVTSAAIGGRSQRVVVYLPPGYAQTPLQRYPVFYLLHGFPGNPDGFVRTVRVGVVEDTLLAQHQLQPMIIVMPFGSSGTFTDEEWVNGIRPHENWETFLTRDVVQAIDSHYRTIPNGAGRALGGLSEGGYASLNIGLHHPGLFRVLESWSGYQKADSVKAIFGGQTARIRRNSPLATLQHAAAKLRRAHTFVWFYTGQDDTLLHQNMLFDAELQRARVAHQFFVIPGGHTWALWRDNAWQAMQVASAHLAHG